MTLTDRLNTPLDLGRVKTRPDGRGGKLAYLESHDVIRTANDIFGFGKWGHEVVELRHIEPVTVHNKDQKAGVCVGYICIVRLTVEGCVPVSGVGFGDATEYRESAAVTAHELAAKESESDALKRALKNYGDQFGLALYDKDAATSGHVTRPGSPAETPAAAAGDGGGGSPQGSAPAAAPSYPKREAKLLELVRKNADADAVERTRTSMEAARARGEEFFDKWLCDGTQHWEFPIPEAARA